MIGLQELTKINSKRGIAVISNLEYDHHSANRPGRVVRPDKLINSAV
jgi:hypothetical protein